jgi:hypothetical protein
LSSEWAGDDIHVDKQHNAQQSAPQSGSALSSANPPGWRPAALDHESSNSVLIEALADPISSKDAVSPGTAAGTGDSADSNDVTFPGTAAGAGDSAEETQMRSTMTDLSCLPNRGIAGAQGVREPIGSAGSQTSPKVSTVPEPSESTQNTCDALDAARCERDTLGTNSRDVNRDQRAHARGTSSGTKTRTTYEGRDGDKYQEAGGGDEEEEGEERDRTSESDQEHEAGSEDEDEYDDNGDGEDEEENDEENDKEDDDKEERGLEGEADPVSKKNNQRQGKRGYGHTTFGRDTIQLLSRPLLPVGALNSDNEALDEAIEVRHDTRNSTDAAHHSGSALSTAPEQRSDRHNYAVREDKCLDVHAGQSVAGPNGAKAVSAQSSPRSRRSNGPTKESFTGTTTTSGHVDADDDNDSTSSVDSSVNMERDLDADNDNRDMPNDEPEPALKTSRTPKKRTSTAVSGAFKTPTKRQKLSSEITGSLTSAVIKNVPSRLIQPPKLMQLIAEMLDDTQKGSAMSLMCFFFSVASPHAFKRLRQACVSVRDSQRGAPVTEKAGVWQSVRALDRIDMHEHVSPILRRYHLVQLVKRRDELYDEIVGSAAHPRSLAPGRGLRKQTAADEMVGTKRAAKLALEHLTSEAYPEHRQEIMKNATQHEKDFKLLQNRLSNGQNWNALQKKFGVGILALVPTGSDAGFSNTE